MDHSTNFSRLVKDAKTRIKEISTEKLLELIENKAYFVLIDVRENDEWVNGHLIGAIHLPRGTLERDIEKVIPEKNTPLVLYCGGGYRSALSADNLLKMGYLNTLSLEGGIKAWQKLNLPISSN